MAIDVHVWKLLRGDRGLDRSPSTGESASSPRLDAIIDDKPAAIDRPI